MFAHVQGCKDASREWGEHVATVICGKLGFTRNRADKCIYRVLIGKHHVIMTRETHDIFVAYASIQAYEFIVTTVEADWKVHNMGLVSHFFGLHFVISRNCMTVDQTHLVVHEVLTYEYGDSWSQQQLFHP